MGKPVELGTSYRAALLLLKVDRRLAFFGVLAVVAGAIWPAVFKVATGILVGAVPGVLRADFTSPAGATFLRGSALVALIHLLQQGWPLIQDVIRASLGFKLSAYVRTGVMADFLEPESIAHLETHTLKDAITRIQGLGSSGSSSPENFVLYLTQVLSIRLIGVGSGVLLLAFKWWVPPVLLAVWWFLHLANEKEQETVYEALRGATSDTRRSHYYRGLATEAGAAKEMRIFGLLDWIRLRYRNHWAAGVEPSRRQRKALTKRHVLGAAILLTSHALVLGVLAADALGGEVSLAELTIFVQSIAGMQAFGPIGILGWRLRESSEPIAEWLDTKDKIRTEVPAVISGARSAEDAPAVAIRVEGVKFAYPGTERPVFDNLDLEIRAGESLAIVGANGAGKTTLVKLLARLFDAQAGKITADDIDIREFDIESWRRRLSVIFQDFVQYPLSAFDNVTFGNPAIRDNRSALESAARRAGATTIIESLPNGWDTSLSRQFSGGAELSAGQWQRVALARALFAVEGGAGVLILDEPTANLDVRAEAEFFDQFLELTRGLTAILISHRFSTVRKAQRICVLEEGRVIEDGSHEKLMELGQRYSRMFRLQAARFGEINQHDA